MQAGIALHLLHGNAAVGEGWENAQKILKLLLRYGNHNLSEYELVGSNTLLLMKNFFGHYLLYFVLFGQVML
jgi:hypothetical protein